MKTVTGRSRSRARFGLGVAFILTASLCLAVAPGGFLAPASTHAQAPSPSASPSMNPQNKVTEILQTLYRTVTQVVEYEQTLQIERTNPYMAQPFLPPYLEGGSPQQTLLATATVQRAGRWDLVVKWPTKNTDLRFTSNDGYNLDFASEKPDFTEVPLTPAPVPPTPAASASPGADASPTSTATPPLLDVSGPGPGDKEVYRYHPLTLIWPFVYKPLATNNEPYKLREDESVLGKMCWVIERNSGDMVMKIWVDQENYSVLQIQYPDPRAGELVTAQYRSFWDPEDGVRSYRTMVVTRGGNHPLYSVTTQAPPNLATTTSGKVVRPGPSASPSGQPTPIIIGQYWERPRAMLTAALWVTVVVLLIGLVWFGGRYIIFLMTRTEFSRDLIVLEAEDSPLSSFLKAQGYVVTRCSMEVLTEERKRLDKKLGTVGTVLPRAVIVGPECFGLIKNYLFLLKAYVEEGGRVLVLRQSASCAKELPFQAYFVPYAQDGRLSLSVRHNILKRLTVKDAETRTGKLLPKEMYVEVNQRKMDIEFVQALNKSTGVRAVLLGVVRQAQGEFILCQFELMADLAHPKVTMGKALLLDVIDYTQGVKSSEKKKPAAS